MWTQKSLRRVRMASIALAVLMLTSTLSAINGPAAGASTVNASIALEVDGTPDGEGDFDTGDGPGEDSGPNNGRLRTLDVGIVRVAFDIADTPATDFILRSDLPPGLVWDRLPAYCRVGDVTVDSTLSPDASSLLCNLGDLPAGYSADVQFGFRPLTSVPNDTDLEIRFEHVHTDDLGAEIVGGTNTISVTVSAAISGDLVADDSRSVVPGQTFQTEWGPADGPSTVTGMVFDDLDGDGVFDGGEVGLAGATLVVTDADGNAWRDASNVPLTATSAADGSFSFADVGPGEVFVRLDGALPSGRRPSTATRWLLRGQGQDIVSAVIGATTVAPPGGLGTISGTVFDDADLDSLLTTDATFPGIEVRLVGLASTGLPVDVTQITDGAGAFTFTSVPESDADGYTVIAAQRGLATVGEEIVVPLAAGQVVSGLNIGFTAYENYGRGIGIRWPFAFTAPGGKGGSELASGAFDFDDVASTISPNTRLMTWSFPCGANGEGVDLLPLPLGSGGDQDTPWAATDSTTVSCSQPAPGADIAVSVLGADTSGRHIATEAFNRDVLPAGANWLVAGFVSTFTPASDLPTCGQEVLLENTFTGFTATDAAGSPVPETDLGNNSHSRTVLVPSCNDAGSGFVPRKEFARSYQESYGGITEYDHAGADEWDRWGDGFINPAGPFSGYMSVANHNDFFSHDVIQCDTIDNARFRLRDIPFLNTPIVVELVNPQDGITANPILTRVFDDDANPLTLRTLAPGEFIVEFGTGGTGDTTLWAGGSGPEYFVDHVEQSAHTRCGDGEIGDSTTGWYDDPAAVPGGSGAVNTIRLRVPALVSGDQITVRYELEAVEYDQSPFGDHLAVGAPWPFGTEFHNYMDFNLNGAWRGCCPWQRRLLTAGSIVRIQKERDPDDAVVTTGLVGDDVTFLLRPTANSLLAGLNVLVSGVVVTDTLPEHFRYVQGSATPPPDVVTDNVDGTTTIEWQFGDVPSELPMPVISYDATIDFDAFINEVLVNTAVISAPSDNSPVEARTSSRTVIATAPLAFHVWKTAVDSFVSPGEDMAYDLWRVNRSDLPLGDQDVIDILPYVGDGLSPATSISGPLQLRPTDPVEISGGEAGTVVWVTNHDRTLINSDPSDASNDIPGGSTSWCDLADVLAGVAPASCPATDVSDVTAIRVIDTTPLLATDDARSARIHLVAPASLDGELATNRFRAHVGGVTNTATAPEATIEVRLGEAGGQVWHDLNGNGFPDDGEPPISPASVRLTGTEDGGAPVDLTTSTDAEGNYLFESLAPGTYQVSFDRPTGFDFWSPMGAGIIGGSDANWVSRSDATAQTATFDMPEAFGKTWDAGVHGYASVGGDVFEDVDGDGLQSGPEGPIPGSIVTLLDSMGDPVTTDLDGAAITPITIGAGGAYDFANLAPGDYQVRFEAPAVTWSLTTKDAGDDALDSDADQATGVAHAVALSLDALGTNHDTDAGMFRLGSIGNLVWADTTMDGIYDSGTEFGVAGVVVELRDASLVPVTDEAGRPVTTATAGDGTYSFTDLPPGTYNVLVRSPFGYAPTLTDAGADDLLDSDADRSGVAQVVHRSGQADVDPAVALSDGSIDVGLVQPASVGDIVWNDVDADGIRDVDEVGLEGITVRLLNAADVTVAAMFTDDQGRYEFEGLLPDNYRVEFIAPAGWRRSPQAAGASDVDSDPDPTTGRTPVFAVTGAGAIDDIDAGLHLPPSVGDLVWYDLDGNGRQDIGEPGAPGVTVHLLDAGGAVALDADGVSVVPAVTDVDGAFMFENLTPGSHRIRFDAPSGVRATTFRATGAPDNDSDADPADSLQTPPFVLTRGVADVDIDAGFVPLADVSGHVYADLNGDGDRTGDDPIESVTVNLDGVTLDGTPVALSTTTDLSGFYSFTDLDPGLYTISQVQPVAWADGADTAGSLGSFGTAAGAIVDPDTDSFVDISIDGTAASVENNFGELPLASVSGTVFEDRRVDGDPAGQPPIAGVSLQLTGTSDAGDPVDLTLTTGADGRYQFGPLDPGLYTVTQTQPLGLADSPATAGTVITDIRIDSGIAVAGQDFGEIGAIFLGDRVWHDLDGDGMQDPAEPGLAGVGITVFDGGGAIVATSTTDADGVWLVVETDGGDLLSAGTYSIEVAAPVGMTFTRTDGSSEAGDSDADRATGIIGPTEMPGPIDGRDLDAGLYTPVQIGDLVWEDVDGDGTQAIDEPGLAGVTVQLLDVGGAVWASTTSAVDGSWLVDTDAEGFPLAPGIYQVQVDAAGGLVPTITEGADPRLGGLDNDLDPATGTSPAFFVDNGTTVNTVDIGMVHPAAIGDRVWHDLDADGLQDLDEDGASGVRVELVAPDGAPVFHIDGSEVEPVLTGLDGTYTFNDVRPGTVRVRVTTDDAWGVSPLGDPDPIAVADDNDVDPVTGSSVPVVLESGDQIDTVDVGVWRTATIGDRIFLDVNGNGVQDADEPGVAGVNITLRNDLDAVVDTDVSDGTGDYRFVGLAPGAYTVEVDPTNGLAFTVQGAGLDPALDSDADTVTGRMPTVAVMSATDVTDLDAGVLDRPFVAGRVFADADNDGVLDPAEVGIADVTVRLEGTDISGRSVSLTTDTDAAGRFRFEAVEPSDATGYAISELQPAGWFDGLDSGPAGATVGNDVISGVVISDGQPALGITFGELPAARISGQVFLDLSLDGHRQGGEPAIDGVTITLSGTDALGNSVSRTTSTGIDGSYEFEGLRGGTYSLVETQPAGFGDGSVQVGSAGGLAGTNEISGVILAAGEHAFGYDFAELDDSVVVGSVAGKAWYDDDRDGVRDIDETAGFAGLRVELLDAGGNVVSTSETDVTGRYVFERVAIGTVTVRVAVPDGFGRTTPELTVVNVIEAGVTDIDAGFVDAVIAGRVVLDDDRDGVLDPAEPGISGVRVELTGVDVFDRAISGTAVTDGSGNFSFDGLLAGTYTVTEIQPADYDDGDDSAGSSGGVVVAPDAIDVIEITGGESIDDIEFLELSSVLTPTLLTGTVFRDVDENGTRDNGELGLAGVEVIVRDGGGAEVARTYSTVGGGYSADVTAGTHSVEVVDPSGWVRTTSSPRSVSVPSSGIDGVDHGYTNDAIAASVDALVFLDRDRDGLPGGDDDVLPGVDVTLVRGGVALGTVPTDQFGRVDVNQLAPGDIDVVETQPAGYANVTPDTVTVTLVAGSSGSVLFADALGSISGNVVIDEDENGAIDPGEDGIAGVEVRLTGTDAAGMSIDITVETSLDGSYEFVDLLDGTYTVAESQPETHDQGLTFAGSLGGTTTGSDDTVADIVLTADDVATGYDFTELVRPVEATAAIEGAVWLDRDADGFPSDGEPGIEGVVLQIVDQDGNSFSAVTDAAGEYILDELAPGTYSITQQLPAGYGATTPTSVFEIILGVAERRTVDFGDRLGSLAGHVFLDDDADDTFDTGEIGIGGVTIRLTGTDVTGADVDVAQQTGADGAFLFEDLLAGTYELEETQPVGRDDGGETVGSAGGTVSADDTISAIDLAANVDAIGYDFAETEIATGAVHGLVWWDDDRDRRIDRREGPGAGVTVELLDVAGDVAHTTVTRPDGCWVIEGVADGIYSARVVPPAGVGTSTPDIRTGIVVNGGESHARGFGLVRASLSGTVWEDKDGDGSIDRREKPLSGVEISLTGTDANGDPVSLTTRAGRNGSYVFEQLLGGTYTVSETQPADRANGVTVAGSAGGITSGSDDVVADITLDAGERAHGYNFGEGDKSRRRNAFLKGTVWNDVDRDGADDPRERGIRGVTVALYDDSGDLVGTTRTNGGGKYIFQHLRPGTYTIIERIPDGYGNTTPSVIDDAIAVHGNGNNDYDFGLVRARLSGRVYVDRDRNGSFDSGDEALGGVTIRVRGTSDAGREVDRSYRTRADGTYRADDLPSGDYSITQEQPRGFQEGPAQPGSAGGQGRSNRRGRPDGSGNFVGQATVVDDVVSTEIEGVLLAPDDEAVNYDFLEYEVDVEFSGLSGSVYVDADGDGVRDPDESGIRDVTIVVSDAAGIPLATVVTGPDGVYMISGLVPGSYSLEMATPSGFTATTPVSVLGVSITPDAVGDVDFGVASVGLTVIVHDDVDGNGTREIDEPGIEGVSISLTGTTGGGSAVSLSGTTDATGQVLFDLEPGTYTVTESTPSGWLDGGETCMCDGTIADDRVSDFTVSSSAVEIVFGELRPASVSGLVFNDTDVDGMPDAVSNPRAGVEIRVETGDGSLLGSAATAADGSWTVGNLRPGDVVVRPVLDTATGISPLADGGNDIDPLTGSSAAVSLTPGAVVGGIDLGLVQTVTVTGVLYSDTNDNGVFDAGESVVGGAVVEIVIDGVVVGSGVTDASGVYRIAVGRTGTATIRAVDRDVETTITIDSLDGATLNADLVLPASADPSTGPTDPSGPTGPGSGLARTGVSVQMRLLIGIGLLALGGAMLVVERRRRWAY